MKISGSNTLVAPVDQVWAALLDPRVLARCIPGCESLTPTGPHSHIVRVTAGVAAIKGTYDGSVALVDLEEPHALTMKARGAGAPGTIEATVAVRLAPSADGGTELSYDADASVGGTIGGVGQRMLAGVTKKMAGQFFSALDADIAGVRPAEVALDAPVGAGHVQPAGVAGAAGAPAVAGETYAGRVPARAGVPSSPSECSWARGWGGGDEGLHRGRCPDRAGGGGALPRGRRRQCRQVRGVDATLRRRNRGRARRPAVVGHDRLHSRHPGRGPVGAHDRAAGHRVGRGHTHRASG